MEIFFSPMTVNFQRDL